MIACRKARAWILRARDGGLGLEQELALGAHLADCAACRAIEGRSARLEEVLARMPEPPVERIDVEAAVARVRERCKADDESRTAVRRAWRRRAALAAALLAISSVAVLRPWEAEGVGTGEVPLARAPEPEQTLAAEDQEPTNARGLADLDSTVGAAEIEVAQGVVVLLDPVPEPEPEPLDEERIERARKSTRHALETALEDWPVDGDAEGFAAAVDLLAQPLASEGWPLERLVERFVDDKDERVALGAVRYLGLRGDRQSARRLARRLEHTRVDAQTLELRRALVFALADAGDAGLDGLQVAARDPELAGEILQVALAVGGERAAQRVVDVLATWNRTGGDPEALAAALDGLAHLGEPGFESLIGLLSEDELPRAGVLAALARVRGGRALLVAKVQDGPARRDVDALLRTAGRLGASDVLEWMGERCRERQHRAAALDGLVALGSTESLDLMLDLCDQGRLSEDDLCLRLEQLEWNAPGCLRAYVQGLDRPGDGDVLALLQGVLVEAEDSWAGSGLLALAANPALDEELRVWAALAVGEIGALEEVPLLTALLLELGPEDKRLAAALLLSVHALGGDEAVAELLTYVESDRRTKITAVLARRTRSRSLAAPLSKLARRLEPWLESADPERRRTTP